MTTLTDRIPPGKPIQYALITQIVTCSCGRESRISKLWKDMRVASRHSNEPTTRREQCGGNETIYANIPWAIPGTTRSATARCEWCLAVRMLELAPMDLLPNRTVRLTPNWATRERAKLAQQEIDDRKARTPRAAKPPLPTANFSDFA